MSSSIKNDLIIIGAGVVGLVLAAILAKNSENLGIKILESNNELSFWNNKEFDKRVYAISRSSQIILDYLGIWKNISSKRISPYRKMKIFDAQDPIRNFGSLEFDSSEVGEPDLGNIVEDSLIRQELINLLHGYSNVSINLGQKIESIDNKHNHIQVSTSKGKNYVSKLLVGADGSNSSVRDLSSISVSRHLFDQYSLVTHVSTQDLHNNTAYQFFLSDGPLAFLPISNNRSSIVLSTSKDKAEALCDSGDKYFCELLTKYSNSQLGKVVSCDIRKCFPIKSFNAEKYCINRTVLLGDAAHCVHPLAGQGVNMGMADAAILSKILRKALLMKIDIGELKLLREYQREARSNNIKYFFAINALYEFFKSSSFHYRVIKSFGIATLNKSSYIKNKLIDIALGRNLASKFDFF